MKGSQLFAVSLISGLMFGTSIAGDALAMRSASQFHYTVKTFSFHSLIPEALNNAGIVSGTTNGDPSGLSQAFVYDGHVHRLPQPPGGWVHADAYDINDHGAMAVSTDNFIASAPVRARRYVTKAYAAFVGTWSRGTTHWYRLNGTTAQRPAANAYAIGPNGDVVGHIFAVDVNGLRSILARFCGFAIQADTVTPRRTLRCLRSAPSPSMARRTFWSADGTGSPLSWRSDSHPLP
jgi:uncharacterized membrane protein